MVDANRLPQVLAGSRADRLKRPIDAAGVWLRISRSNGIPEFPVRRDELTEELTPVTALATTALQTAEGKLDAGQVMNLLNSAFSELFQEYPLVGGMEHREIDPTDGREYRYTVFVVQTRYTGTFEELALVSNDANETLLDVEHGVYKEPPGRIVFVFRDMTEGFADGTAKIKLVGIPTLETAVIPTPTGEPTFTANPTTASVGANTAVTLTFSNYPVGGTYKTDAYINNADYPNGTQFRALADAIPDDISANPTYSFNTGIFAGMALPIALDLLVQGSSAGDQIVRVTINP